MDQQLASKPKKFYQKTHLHLKLKLYLTNKQVLCKQPDAAKSSDSKCLWP